VITALLLAASWTLWSGPITTHGEHPLVLVFGVLSVLGVVWLKARMDAVDGTREPYALGLRWIPYVFWLLPSHRRTG